MFQQRKIIRLQKYDYSKAGYYFVTVCVKDRLCVFGEIAAGRMELNQFGNIVNACWTDLPNHYTNCVLDEFVIMPNHMHGILIIMPVGEGLKPSPTRTHGLSEMIRGFKTFSSRKINITNNHNFSWQRSFYDHVIRKDDSLNRIREYIKDNPLKWERDRNNPENIWM